MEATNQGQVPNGTPPAGEPPKPQDQHSETPPAPSVKSASREQLLEAELKRARAEAASYRQKARTEAEAKKKAEEEALAQNGKFKELAESREKRATELEAELEQSRARLAEYEQREAGERQKREAQVAADFAALPDDVRSEVPEDADLRTKEIAIRLHQRTAGAAKPRPPQFTPTAPRPAGFAPSGTLTADEEAQCAQTIGNPRASAKDKAEARAKLAAHNAAAAQGR